MEKWLYIPIFAPIIAGVIVYLFNRDRLFYSLYAVQGLLFTVSWNLMTTDGAAPVTETVGGWDPVIGISLHSDATIAKILMLSTLLFTVILLYVHKSKENDYKFLFFYMLLQGVFNGFILSYDLFNIFVMLELVTILSTILILYKKDGYSLNAGLYYLLFNSLGMIFFLVGVVMIYSQYGTLNIGLISQAIEAGHVSGTLRYAVILMVSGFSVKSAVFPVYDWLPRAHSASLTSISALLSGLLVKAGIFGLMRIEPLYRIYNTQPVFLTLGIVTAGVGVVFAFSRKDIKQILSFHTVSQIGLIMIGFSINMDIAMLYLINHSLIKSLLFLASGVVINRYKERRVTHIDSLWRNNKPLSILLALSAAALAGLPLTNGFISKSALAGGFHSPWMIGILIAVNLMTVASMTKILSILPGQDARKVWMGRRKAAAMMVLGGLILIGGMIFTDPVTGSHTLGTALKAKNLMKWMAEFGLGFLVYIRLTHKEPKFLRRMRHFSIDFPDGVMLLTFYISILALTVT